MAQAKDFQTNNKPTWCPACGNYGSYAALTQAFAELGLEPHQVVMTFDIGCNGNGANNYRLYGFHSLHGRTIPVATAVKLANNDLTVVALSGDGGGYGEGGNHFLHACRRNVNMTLIIHNNERYSLTTGQTSPTTRLGDKTKTALVGSIDQPLNGPQIALTAGATFVARGFADDMASLKEIYKRALTHKGFSVVELLQPCVIFYGAKNIRDEYRSKIYKLDSKNWPTKDRQAAYQKAGETARLPIGIFFQEARPTFESHFKALANQTLVSRPTEKVDLTPFLKELK
ncbi:MAG: thiamine pyrophosphate-dependent enzyme [Patescibacteria group bacterium]|nr:thiamine pyrophosphate-dependent enzyme [Patescibacteria group bacterium]